MRNTPNTNALQSLTSFDEVISTGPIEGQIADIDYARVAGAKPKLTYIGVNGID